MFFNGLLQHMGAPVLGYQQGLTYIHSSDTGCSLEELPGAMDDRDG